MVIIKIFVIVFFMGYEKEKLKATLEEASESIHYSHVVLLIMAGLERERERKQRERERREAWDAGLLGGEDGMYKWKEWITMDDQNRRFYLQ